MYVYTPQHTLKNTHTHICTYEPYVQHSWTQTDMGTQGSHVYAMLAHVRPAII